MSTYFGYANYRPVSQAEQPMEVILHINNYF